MESPLERVTLALREAIAQAREDGAKLPGSKGRLLEAQALRWRRALAGIDAMRPVAQPPDPDLPELLRHLERRAIDDDACGREDDADRLRRCAATGCDDVLVDLTKNAGRRFCGTACANRSHAAAYRARRATG